ncbi:hypothetical protein HK405_003103, partial [Cladochytrium tenue]
MPPRRRQRTAPSAAAAAAAEDSADAAAAAADAADDGAAAGSNSKRRRTASHPAAGAAAAPRPLTAKDLSFERVVARIVDSQPKRGVLHYLVEFAPDPPEGVVPTAQDREILATLPSQDWLRGDNPAISDEQIDDYTERCLEIITIIAARPKGDRAALMLQSSPYAGREPQDLEFLAELCNPVGPKTRARGDRKVEKVAWRKWDLLSDEWKEKVANDHRDIVAASLQARARLDAIPHIMKDSVGTAVRALLASSEANEGAFSNAIRFKQLNHAKEILRALGPRTSTSGSTAMLYKLAARAGDIEYLRIVREFLPDTPWNTVFEAVVTEDIDRILIDEILKYATAAVSEVDAYRMMASAALKECNPAAAVYLLSKLHSLQTAESLAERAVNGASSKNAAILRRVTSFSTEEEQNGFINLPKDGPFTLLHWECLTAKSISEITAPVNDLSVNAGSLGLYLSPVHCAAMNPHPEIIAHLMEHGADMTLSDTNNLLPLHYAAMGGWGIYRHVVDTITTDNKESVSPTLSYLYESDKIEGKEVINWLTIKRDRFGDVMAEQPPLVTALRSRNITNCLWLRNWCLWNTEARLDNWYEPLFNQAVKMGSMEFFQRVHIVGLWTQGVFYYVPDKERPAAVTVRTTEYLKAATPLASILCVLAIAPRPYTVEAEVVVEQSTAKKSDPDEMERDEDSEEEEDEDEATTGPIYETILIDPSGLSMRASLLARELAGLQKGLPILRVLIDPRPSEASADAHASYDLASGLYAQLRPELVPAMQLDEQSSAAVLGSAVQAGQVAAAQYLIEVGEADVHASDDNGCTMLMKCTREGHLDCVRLLVEKGADVNQGRDTGDDD